MNILEVKTVVKNFCKNLKRHVIETTNFKRLKLPLTEEENKPHKKQKLVIYAEINFNNNEKNKCKLQDHRH